MTNPTIAPERIDVPTGDDETERLRPWIVIVHNDPINLMSYVTWVLQRLFGYDRPKAHKLMMDVHTKGRAVGSAGAPEEAEADSLRPPPYGVGGEKKKEGRAAGAPRPAE